MDPSRPALARHIFLRRKRRIPNMSSRVGLTIIPLLIHTLKVSSDWRCAPLQIGRNILGKTTGCGYIYIYIWLHIYMRFSVSYCPEHSSLGYWRKISAGEAWGCSGAASIPILILAILILIYIAAQSLFHHYDNSASDRVPVADSEKPRMWGSVCHLRSCCAGTGDVSWKRAGPAMNPASLFKSASSEKRAVGITLLSGSQPQQCRLSMLLAQDMNRPDGDRARKVRWKTEERTLTTREHKK